MIILNRDGTLAANGLRERAAEQIKEIIEVLFDLITRLNMGREARPSIHISGVTAAMGHRVGGTRAECARHRPEEFDCSAVWVEYVEPR